MGQKMGFRGEAFYGVAGATAATRITESRDISYDFDPENGDTTTRGNSDVPPIETGSVTSRKVSLTIQMVNKSSDPVLAAMLAAAYAGTPVAIRLKDYAAGKGFDGDVNLTVKHGMPLKGEQTYEFSATPNRDLRTPQLYV